MSFGIARTTNITDIRTTLESLEKPLRAMEESGQTKTKLEIDITTRVIRLQLAFYAICHSIVHKAHLDCDSIDLLKTDELFEKKLTYLRTGEFCA